MYAKNMFSITW